MKKKNGFVSMSIIYSFFAVFTLVSSSLLLVYSTNLSIVKEKNREIKNEITQKGNDSLMLFQNLIEDGGFEDFYVSNANFDWGQTYKLENGVYKLVEHDYRPKNSVIYNSSKGGKWRAINSGDTYSRRLLMGSDTNKYSGFGAIGFKGKEKSGGTAGIHNIIQSNKPFKMYEDHYYYISRVYSSWGDIQGSELILGLMKYSSETDNTLIWDTSSTKYYNILTNAKGFDGAGYEDLKYYNTDINISRTRYESGYCLGVNRRCGDPKASEHCAKTPDWFKSKKSPCTIDSSIELSNTNANTFESGIFLFSGSDGYYRLVIGENFSESSSEGVQKYYISDNYILIDINSSLQYSINDLKQKLELKPGESLPPKAKHQLAARNIDEMLDGRYFEGNKVFSKARFNLVD